MIIPENWKQEFYNLIKESGIDHKVYGFWAEKNPMKSLCKIIKLFIFCQRYESVLPSLCVSIKENLKRLVAEMYVYTENWTEYIPQCIAQLSEKDIFYIPATKYPELVVVHLEYQKRLITLDSKKRRSSGLFKKKALEEKLLDWIFENQQIYEK